MRPLRGTGLISTRRTARLAASQMPTIPLRETDSAQTLHKGIHASLSNRRFHSLCLAAGRAGLCSVLAHGPVPDAAGAAHQCGELRPTGVIAARREAIPFDAGLHSAGARKQPRHGDLVIWA